MAEKKKVGPTLDQALLSRVNDAETFSEGLNHDLLLALYQDRWIRKTAFRKAKILGLQFDDLLDQLLVRLWDQIVRRQTPYTSWRTILGKNLREQCQRAANELQGLPVSHGMPKKKTLLQSALHLLPDWVRNRFSSQLQGLEPIREVSDREVFCRIRNEVEKLPIHLLPLAQWILFEHRDKEWLMQQLDQTETAIMGSLSELLNTMTEDHRKVYFFRGRELDVALESDPPERSPSPAQTAITNNVIEEKGLKSPKAIDRFRRHLEHGE